MQFLQDRTGGGYRGHLAVEDAASQAELNRTYKLRVRQPCCAELTGAKFVAEMLLYDRKRGAWRSAWASDLSHSAALDLGGQAAITARYGPEAGGAGWSGREHLVNQLEASIDCNRQQVGLAVGAREVHHWLAAQVGSEPSLGDALPYTVL
jgi:hypothetical protein